MTQCRLNSAKIMGYRPFRDFAAQFGPLEVLVGANGSGKSSLFEFLRFLRDSVYQDIPPEIVAGGVGQQVFHSPGEDRFRWGIQVDMGRSAPVCYEGELIGPTGRTHIAWERVAAVGARAAPGSRRGTARPTWTFASAKGWSMTPAQGSRRGRPSR